MTLAYNLLLLPLCCFIVATTTADANQYHIDVRQDQAISKSCSIRVNSLPASALSSSVSIVPSAHLVNDFCNYANPSQIQQQRQKQDASTTTRWNASFSCLEWKYFIEKMRGGDSGNRHTHDKMNAAGNTEVRGGYEEPTHLDNQSYDNQHHHFAEQIMEQFETEEALSSANVEKQQQPKYTSQQQQRELPREQITWLNKTWQTSPLPGDNRNLQPLQHDITLPKGYEWSSDWNIDISATTGTDKNGWYYYRNNDNARQLFRRRRWLRTIRPLSLPPSHQSPITTDNEQQELPPKRFLLAAKNDPVLGWKRYRDTLAWRYERNMDTILSEPHFHFQLIKEHYPHYFHLRGYNNEPVYYEKPARMNLKELKAAGITMDILLRHYSFVTEFMWQVIEPCDGSQNIYIIDLDGITIRDFMGEVIQFVRKASGFTSQHYPERSGSIFVFNAPIWFNTIWSVIKTVLDPVTLTKIRILPKSKKGMQGKQQMFNELVTRIDPRNIPPEYGGYSMPLGQSPEEQMLQDLVLKNQERHGKQPVIQQLQHQKMSWKGNSSPGTQHQQNNYPYRN